MGKRSKGWEDKFVKLKDVYQKLREEHINLLRQKAEVDKKLSTANASLEDSNKIQLELQDSLQLSKASLKEAQNELGILKGAEDEKIQKICDEKKVLQDANDQLMVSCNITLIYDCFLKYNIIEFQFSLCSQATISTAERKIEDIENKLSTIQQEKTELETETQMLKATLEQNVKERKELEQTVNQLKTSATNADAEFVAFKSTQEATIIQIAKEKEELSGIREDLQVN